MSNSTAIVVALFLLTSCAFAQSGAVQVPSKEQSSTLTPSGSVMKSYDQELSDVVEHAMLSVVEIKVSGFGPREDDTSNSQVIERQRAIGSGVIVDPSGYIITNHHVIAGAQRIQVILAPATMELVAFHASLAQHQRTYEAKLIGSSRLVDLALIKIEASGLPSTPLPLDFRVRLGQTVLAIGSPDGLDHTVTKGIVSAVGRQPEIDRPMVYVQTDAPINPGNSGGPLIDRDGNLIGINTFIFTAGGGSEGLGFAIPEPAVRFVYQELREHGRVRQTSIGANPQTITPVLAAGLKLQQDWGVIISDVSPGGPADKAGLKPRDIVKSLDGRPMDSLPKFSAFLYLHPRDLPMQMEVLRGNDTVMLGINPVDVPSGIDSLADLVDPQNGFLADLGIFVVDLDQHVAAVLPDLRSKSGVVVAALLDSEPLLSADLAAGDIIRSFNGRQLSSGAELKKDLQTLKPGDAAVLEVERQGVVRFVAFEME